MNRKCDKDCFNCPYEECIFDGVDAEDYAELAKIERELLTPKSLKEKRRAAAKRAYYESHREELAAKNRAYYESHREELAAKKKSLPAEEKK